ncbi:MAG: NAD(P)-binding domain-containing protein [Gammaproteobacteria bacterium]|nr:NAD(P)-binding domain-containing protein [Gammaproteobacteria bacterium]
MSKKVCIIGAGPSGIAAAKNCKQYGLDFDIFEKNDKVGGNWVFNSKTGHSSVYENTHIISSKLPSEYEDYPMPESYPEYPRHDQLQAYFENYSKHFGFYNEIKFNHVVDNITRTQNDLWLVEFTDAQGNKKQELYEKLMVANGHHWMPKYPVYEGEFTGKWMHSHDFKGVNDEWRDKKVLVIGAGNSGCDVATESTRVTKTVSLSMRSPQWFFPKFMLGLPSDILLKAMDSLPAEQRQDILTQSLTTLVGDYAKIGLPVNTKPPMSQHPTLNSDLIDYIRHGKIKIKPGIKKLDGKKVEFTDGSIQEFDIICCCTGFWTVFPFFDESLINFKKTEKVPLYRKMMHSDFKNLYFIGLFQPIGCIWPLADFQSNLACQEILGNYHRPSDIQAAIEEEINNPHYKFEGGQRHAVQVDYLPFREELVSDLASAGVTIPPRNYNIELPEAAKELLAI